MSATLDIVGIGVCTVDHLVTVPRMPHRNENMKALNYTRQLGGLASISLIAAARLGARAKIISRIGDDDNGAYIRGVLQSEGLDVSQLLVEAGSESHVSVILVHQPTGDRSIITRPPTGEPISLGEIQRDVMTAARVLFVDDINDTTLQAARWAQAAGMKVVLDPARPYAEIKPLLSCVDVPIVPAYWAENLMPGKPPAAVAERLVGEGAEIAVVTLGERGAVVCWEGGTRAIPAYPVDVSGYHRRRRCLSRRIHVCAAARLGGAAYGALCFGCGFDELPRHRWTQRAAYAPGGGCFHGSQFNLTA